MLNNTDIQYQYNGNNDSSIVRQFAKIWEPISKNDATSWCIPSSQADDDNNISQGLIFVKVPKAASSTGVGVTLQAAKNVAKLLNYNTSCQTYSAHGNAFTQRIKPYFLWTMIREPSKRSISSYFFFEVGRKGMQASTTGMVDFLNQQRLHELSYLVFGSTDKLMNYIRRSKLDYIGSFEMIVKVMVQENIMDVYNFIALVERMDESLVVLKMLMHLQDEDIITLPSKQSGGYDDGKYNDTCNFIPKSYTTPHVDKYIESAYKKNNPDYLLYRVVNKSLDMTIDALGRDKVEAGVRRHRELKEIATKYCASKAIYPCSETGVKQPESELDCLSNDAGCGYECVGDILTKYKNGELG